MISGITDINRLVRKILVEKEGVRGDGAIAADPAFPENGTSGPKRQVGSEFGIALMVASDSAPLIHQQVVGISPPSEHGPERVDEEKDRRKFDFIENLDAMKGLVEQEQFGRKPVPRPSAVGGIGREIEEHRVLIAMERIE